MSAKHSHQCVPLKNRDAVKIETVPWNCFRFPPPSHESTANTTAEFCRHAVLSIKCVAHEKKNPKSMWKHFKVCLKALTASYFKRKKKFTTKKNKNQTNSNVSSQVLVTSSSLKYYSCDRLDYQLINCPVLTSGETDARHKKKYFLTALGSPGASKYTFLLVLPQQGRDSGSLLIAYGLGRSQRRSMHTSALQ